MCWQATQTYPCDRSSPRLARRFVRDQLRAALGPEHVDSGLSEVAETVTSELVTNAVNARSTRAWLTLSVHRERANIAVVDDAPGEPRVLETSADADHGRGLQIVAGLSDGWGVQSLQRGKRVWADICLPHAATQSLRCRLAGPPQASVPAMG